MFYLLGWWCAMGFFFPPKSWKTLPLDRRFPTQSSSNQNSWQTLCSKLQQGNDSHRKLQLKHFSGRLGTRGEECLCFYQLQLERDGAQAHTQILPFDALCPTVVIRLIPSCSSSAGRKIQRSNGAIKKRKNTKTFVWGSRDLKTGNVGGQSAAGMLPCCNISLSLYVIQTSTMRLSHHIRQ